MLQCRQLLKGKQVQAGSLLRLSLIHISINPRSNITNIRIGFFGFLCVGTVSYTHLGSVRFNVVKGRTYYIYVHSYHYSFPEGYTYQLATSFKGPKATPAKKTTNTSKKPVKMVTGVSLKVKKKKINIRFKLVSNVSKYQIMYSTKKSFKNKKVVTVRSGNVTIKKLKRKKTYFIRVRAISKNGKAGAWSVVKKVRVK